MEDNLQLVLMDIQMPEMGGLEATRLIRATHPALPIVGQTAHALKSEHDKCLAAGMNATITKPIEIERLIEVVLLCAYPAATDPVQVSPSVAVANATSTQPPTVDWSALRNQYPKRPEFIDRLIAMDISLHQSDAQRLRDLAREEMFDRIERISHQLKGFAGNLCATELLIKATDTMISARAFDQAANDQALELADALDRLLAELAKDHSGASLPEGKG